MKGKSVVQVPGKIMLAGEYSVLWGGNALSATVDRLLNIEMVSRESSEGQAFKIESELWDEPFLASTLDFEASHLKNPIFQTLKEFNRLHPLPPFHLKIYSDFKVSYGMGSSSALYIGLLLACSRFLSQDIDKWALAQWAHRLQRISQGFSSGYDIYTQTFGGLIQFHPDAKIKSRLSQLEHLKNWVHCYVGGSGASTTKVGERTLNWIGEHRKWFPILCTSERLIRHCLRLLRGKTNFQPELGGDAFFLSVRQFRKHFELAPFYPTQLLAPLTKMAGVDHKWSYKTTGAGGEDALLLFGDQEDLAQAHSYLDSLGWSKLEVQYLEHGAQILC